MTKAERIERLKELAQEGQSLSLNDLASELGVSITTIRADLSAMGPQPTPKKQRATKASKPAKAKPEAKQKVAKKQPKTEPKIKFSDRLAEVIKKAKKNKDGTISIPASKLEEAGFARSAYVHAAYWRSYNNTGTKGARELGFKASLTTIGDSEKGDSERVLILTKSS